MRARGSFIRGLVCPQFVCMRVHGGCCRYEFDFARAANITRTQAALTTYVLPYLKKLLLVHLEAAKRPGHKPLLEQELSTLRARELSHRGPYAMVLGRLRNDAGWQPFVRHVMQLAGFCARIEGAQEPTQTQSDLLQSYFDAHQVLPRFTSFLQVCGVPCTAVLREMGSTIARVLSINFPQILSSAQKLAKAAGARGVITGVKDAFRFLECAGKFDVCVSGVLQVFWIILHVPPYLSV